MTATFSEALNTTFQRYVLAEVQDTLKVWKMTPDGQLARSYSFPKESGYFVLFQGNNLDVDVAGNPTGTITGYTIMRYDSGYHYNFLIHTVVSVTGLKGFDAAKFDDMAGKITIGDPDYSHAPTKWVYNQITPRKTIGSDEKDQIEVGTKPVIIKTGDGDDVVLAGPGGGTVDMGKGTKDAVDFRNVDTGIKANLGKGEATSDGKTWKFIGVEVLFGTEQTDNLTGSDNGDRIFGRGDGDVIRGKGGNDTLRGDDGRDTIIGGDGRDKIFGDNHNDTLLGGDKKDRIKGGRARTI